MRRATLFVAFAVFALVVQTTLVPLLTGARFTIELVVMYVVYLGMRQHTAWAVVAAFLLGYLVDTISGTLYGLNAFAMTVVYMAVYWTSRHLWMDNVVSQVFVVALAEALKQIVVGAVLALAWGMENGSRLLEIGVWTTVATALVSPAIFAVLERADEFAAQEED
ncbi:MAG: hypothetical protein KatS3mg077_1462 [Candidatus Binatia bacterium]|nr:MAG: hypothetical protein KatS3mg077_1462 [Candidatus Binatia bacterium]